MDNMPVKKMKTEDGEGFKYSIKCNPSDRRLFQIISYYLGHNISLTISGNMKINVLN